MSKHTPGPWITRHSAGHEIHGQSIIYPEGDGHDIAVVYDGDKDADLIAAAPELLDIVRSVAYAELRPDYLKNHLIPLALSVLAKAEGSNT